MKMCTHTCMLLRYRNSARPTTLQTLALLMTHCHCGTIRLICSSLPYPLRKASRESYNPLEIVDQSPPCWGGRSHSHFANNKVLCTRGHLIKAPQSRERTFQALLQQLCEDSVLCRCVHIHAAPLPVIPRDSQQCRCWRCGQWYCTSLTPMTLITTRATPMSEDVPGHRSY